MQSTTYARCPEHVKSWIYGDLTVTCFDSKQMMRKEQAFRHCRFQAPFGRRVFGVILALLSAAGNLRELCPGILVADWLLSKLRQILHRGRLIGIIISGSEPLTE